MSKLNLPQLASPRVKHVVGVIAATATLMRYSSGRDTVTDEALLTKTNAILNSIWDFEFKMIQKDEDPHHRQLLVRCFWDCVHTDLETQNHASKFSAVFDESVNPPGKQGRVLVSFAATNTVETIRLVLDVKQ